MSKRVLKDIVIDEISAVDKPAQPGAVSTIMKRFDPKKEGLAKKNNPVHKQDKKDLNNPLDSDGDRSMKKSLLASAALVAGVIGKFDDGNYSDADALEIRKAAFEHGVQGLLPKTGPLSKMSSDEESQKMKDDAKKMKDDEDMDKLKKSNDRLNAIIGLSAVEKAHFDTLDDDGKNSFLKMDASDRVDTIEKASAKDPVIFKSIDGMEFRKSDDPRLVQMAKSNDEKTRELAKANAKAKTSAIEKRAAEFDKLPGSDAVKKSVIGAIMDIDDEDIQKDAFAMLKAANSANDGDFKRQGGISKADVADANTRLEKMAKGLMAENDGMTFESAYTKAASSAEGRELYASVMQGEE